MTAKRTPAKELARDFITLLEWLDVYAPRIAAEVRRVLNVSTPIAETVYNGWVNTLSARGYSHLEDGLIEVYRVYTVVSERSDYAASMAFHEVWDAARKLEPDYTEDDVPACIVRARAAAKPMLTTAYL